MAGRGAQTGSRDADGGQFYGGGGGNRRIFGYCAAYSGEFALGGDADAGCGGGAVCCGGRRDDSGGAGTGIVSRMSANAGGRYRGLQGNRRIWRGLAAEYSEFSSNADPLQCRRFGYQHVWYRFGARLYFAGTAASCSGLFRRNAASIAGGAAYCVGAQPERDSGDNHLR